MANATKPMRPLSPHLSIWKWGPHMAVSIVHRVTGSGMATLGTILLVWWLAALATGRERYEQFVGLFTTSAGHLNIIGWVFAVGFTLSFFQHMMSGIRHFVMDVGAGYELKSAKNSALATFVGSVVLTALFWAYMIWGK